MDRARVGTLGGIEERDVALMLRKGQGEARRVVDS